MRDIETSSELLDIKRKVRELEARVKAAEELLEASGQLVRRHPNNRPLRNNSCDVCKKDDFPSCPTDTTALFCTGVEGVALALRRDETRRHTMTIENIQTLDALKSALEAGISADWSDLPTFGGDAPDDTTEVWSWDADRVLVGSCADDLAIMDRDDEDGWWGHTEAAPAVDSEVVEEHFSRWGQTDPANSISGFIEWAWDVLSETLESIEGDDYEEIASEMSYSVRQEDQHRGLDDDAVEAAAVEWLKANRAEIIDALKSALNEC